MKLPKAFTRAYWDARVARRFDFPSNVTSGAAIVTYTYATTPDQEPIVPTFQGLVDRCYSENPVVFGAIQARASLFSEAEFKWQDLNDRHLFGNADLAKLEQPWPGGTTG